MLKVSPILEWRIYSVADPLTGNQLLALELKIRASIYWLSALSLFSLIRTLSIRIFMTLQQEMTMTVDFFVVESFLFLSIVCMFHKRYSGEIHDQQPNWKMPPDRSRDFLSLFGYWEHLFRIINVKQEPSEEGIKEISASVSLLL